MTIGRNQLIGERVRLYRKNEKLTQQELAESLPITPQQLANYETGKSRWPADLICEVSRLLKVDIRILLGMEG